MQQPKWSSIHEILLVLTIVSISGCVSSVQDTASQTTMMIRDKVQGMSQRDSVLRVWFKKSAAIYHVPFNHSQHAPIQKMIKASKIDGSLLCITFLPQTLEITTITDCSTSTLSQKQVL